MSLIDVYSYELTYLLNLKKVSEHLPCYKKQFIYFSTIMIAVQPYDMTSSMIQ